MNRKRWSDAELVNLRMLAEQGMSQTQLAQAMGVARTTVVATCARFGIEVSKAPSMKDVPRIFTRHCMGCGERFESNAPGCAYCSDECRGEQSRRRNRPPPRGAVSDVVVVNFPAGHIIRQMSMLGTEERRKAALGWPEFAATQGLRLGWVSKADLLRSGA